MKIAFWSPVHGQTCTTAGLISVAVHTALTHPELNSMLVQTHFMSNGLDGALLGIKNRNTDTYLRTGIDAILDSVSSRVLDAEILSQYSVTVRENLSLITMTEQTQHDVFMESMNSCFLRVLRELDRRYDLTFIDVSAGCNDLSLKILAAADIVVICINQNAVVTEEFLNKQFSAISDTVPFEKVFWLFGNFDPLSKSTLRNLSAKYAVLRNHNVGAILQCTGFRDALADGRVVRFFLKNLKCDRYDANYQFMQNLAEITEKLLAMIKRIRSQKGGADA